MQLVLVRHGQSTWNLEHRLQGQAMDVPLTPLGHEQAALAARRVATLVAPGAPVWCSDQLRAVQTAEHVAGALGVVPCRTELLREQSLGALEGRPTGDLVEEPVPAGLDVSEVAWGGGETLQQVHERSRRLLGMVAGLDQAAVVLVGHGDALRVLIAAARGRGHREVEWLDLPTGGVVVEPWTP